MTRGLTWTSSALGTDEYVAYWTERIGQTSAIPREHWDAELRRLEAEGIFAVEDEDQFTAEFRSTARESASPRPGLLVMRRWPLAETRDPRFPLELRSALHDVLEALWEPRDVLARKASEPISAEQRPNIS